MQAYIVKMTEGQSSGDMMTLDVMAFTSYECAEEFALTKNKKMDELSEKYKALPFETIDLTNRLFASYLSKTDSVFYNKLLGETSKGENEEEVEKFWQEHMKRFDVFMKDIDAVENSMRDMDVTDEEKANVRIAVEYNQYENGLPYYHVSKSPIRVIQIDSI